LKKAWGIGQIEPVVPVWKSGPDSSLRGLVYVVLPGNVGDTETLAHEYKTFISSKDLPKINKTAEK